MKRLLLLILLPLTIYSKTWYFSYSTGNNSNAGTISSPKQYPNWFFESSWGSLGIGDTILLKRGDTFPVLWRMSAFKGTAQDWFYIGAYGTGDRPILDGTSLIDDKRTIRWYGMEYVHMDSLHIKGRIDFQVYPSTSAFNWIKHFKMTNLYIEGVTGQTAAWNIVHFYNKGQMLVVPDSTLSNKGVTYTQLSTSYPIHDVEIFNCYVDAKDVGNDAIALGKCDSNITIRYCTIYNAHEEGIDIGAGKNILIEYNKVYNCNIGAGIKIHSQDKLVNNATIRGNLIVNSQNSWSILATSIENSKIYHNTLIDYNALWVGNRDRWSWASNMVQYDTATHTDLPTGGWATYYGTFQNNIIQNNIFAGAVSLCGMWDNMDDPDTITARNVFRNNLYHPVPPGFPNYSTEGIICWDSYTTVGVWDGKSSIDPAPARGTKYYHTGTMSTWTNLTTNEIYQVANDATFVNPIYTTTDNNWGEYTLKTGSSAIEAGTRTGIPTGEFLTDMNGNYWNTSTPSVGAFATSTEYVPPINNQGKKYLFKK